MPDNIRTLQDLFEAWTKDAFCSCEIEKIEEHECPLDGDKCNCCAYCTEQCEMLRRTQCLLNP